MSTKRPNNAESALRRLGFPLLATLAEGLAHLLREGRARRRDRRERRRAKRQEGGS